MFGKLKNMAITIRKVESRSDLRKFAEFPNVLYKDSEYYVPQIVSMDMDTFSPEKNRAFEVCEAQYWLAYNDAGKIVGRVAGIINHKYNKKVGVRICRFGWIDYINDQEVCHKLMSTVEEYARSKEMEMVEGPVGFLEFDVAGILVDGFDQYPTAYGKYNDPYYEPLILNEGYVKETDFVEYRVKVPDNVDKFIKLGKLIGERYQLKEAPLNRKSDILKYVDGIFAVMNKAYSKLHGFSELSPAQCEDLKNQFFDQLDMDYVSVILDSNDKVVAFAITLPSLSMALRKANGSLFPFGFIHVLKALKHNDTIDALLIAIDDDYKDKGVNAMLMAKIGTGYIKHGIKWLESTRELENNLAVQNMWGRFEHKLHKRARVYIKTI